VIVADPFVLLEQVAAQGTLNNPLDAKVGATAPRVSIIIPCTAVDEFTRECVRECQALDYDNFEIIVLPDLDEPMEDVIVLPTGHGFPGEKRNIGAKIATGEIFAFIDSDAYPRKDWLRNAVKYLQQDKVGAVGGPGLTPSSDGEFAQAQGEFLGSFLIGGLSARYAGKDASESDDIHSVNFVVWRHVLEEAGGWDEHYWPGEDTLICLAIRKLGYKQLMTPDVLVYHHRRGTWRGYLTQIGRYATHRGYFAKKFPETSRRLGYFLPSAMVLTICILVCASLLFTEALLITGVLLLMYLALVVIVIGRSHFRRAHIALIAIPLTHVVYGLAFMKGLASRGLSN
jgi:cellulose synthase/poly-beta-1,6-N-acetylglucosamine synthase-like glycosyltransferase